MKYACFLGVRVGNGPQVSIWTRSLTAVSVRPEGWEKLTLNRCNFSHFLSIITPVKVEFLTLYVNNYTN